MDRCSQNLSQNDDRCLMRNTLVLSVRGSLPAGAPGEPLPPTTADADAGPLAASHIPDTEAEAVMPSAPNLNTVPPALDEPRRRGPSADAGGDEMVGDSIAAAGGVVATTAVSDLRRRVVLAAASLQDDRSGDDMGRRRRRRHVDRDASGRAVYARTVITLVGQAGRER